MTESFKLTREDALNEMVEVEMVNEDSFRIVRETLERIGIPTRKDDGSYLYQTAHILHKQGRYYITHFKLLFAMDGKYVNLDDEDVCRQNRIANMLEEWGLVNVLSTTDDEDADCMRRLKIIPRREKESWNIVQKYSIGFREGGSNSEGD